MIIVSDNTATNLVLDQVTTEAVNTYMDTLGLAATRSLRKVRGSLAERRAATAGARPASAPRTSASASAPPPRARWSRCSRCWSRARSSAPRRRRTCIGILKRQQFKTGIGRRVGDEVQVASKSGSLDALRSDVGIAYTKTGRIAMAITVDDMPAIDYSPDNAGEELIWEISKALMAGLAR